MRCTGNPRPWFVERQATVVDLRRAARRGGCDWYRVELVPLTSRVATEIRSRRATPAASCRSVSRPASDTSGTVPSGASGYPRAVPLSSGQRLLRFDRRLDARFVAGADEAGRGSLAGPLVVAGVLLDYAGAPRSPRPAAGAR